jgi:hypothetical protein
MPLIRSPGPSAAQQRFGTDAKMNGLGCDSRGGQSNGGSDRVSPGSFPEVSTASPVSARDVLRTPRERGDCDRGAPSASPPERVETPRRTRTGGLTPRWSRRGAEPDASTRLPATVSGTAMVDSPSRRRVTTPHLPASRSPFLEATWLRHSGGLRRAAQPCVAPDAGRVARAPRLAGERQAFGPMCNPEKPHEPCPSRVANG